MDELSHNYAFVVMDNEAGMEHLSRRTTQDIDELFLVCDHSIKSVRTVARLKELIRELKLNVKRESIILNSVPDGIDPFISEEMTRLGIEPTVTVPLDEQMREYDLRSKPLTELPDTSTAARAMNDFMTRILKK